MSKFITFDEVKFVSRECLLAALAALGYDQGKIEEGQALPLYGYLGDERAETAELVIRRQHVGRLSNDLGFRKTAAGYVPVVSEYDTRHLANKHKVGDFVVALRAEYGKAVVAELARRLHGSVKQTQQGNVHKLVVRW